MRSALFAATLATALLTTMAAQAQDRPQPSTTPPPGPAYSSPSMLTPPSVVIDPMMGTSGGGARDRQSDARGIPSSPLGNQPPGLNPQTVNPPRQPMSR